MRRDYNFLMTVVFGSALCIGIFGVLSPKDHLLSTHPVVAQVVKKPKLDPMPPPPPAAEEFTPPAHSERQHQGSTVVDIDISRIKELEAQPSQTVGEPVLTVGSSV